MKPFELGIEVVFIHLDEVCLGIKEVHMVQGAFRHETGELIMNCQSRAIRKKPM